MSEMRPASPGDDLVTARGEALLAVQVAVAWYSSAILARPNFAETGPWDGGFGRRHPHRHTCGKAPWSEAKPEFFHELLRRIRAIPAVLWPDWRPHSDGERQLRGARITALHDAGRLEVESDARLHMARFFGTLYPGCAGRDCSN
jgi:hypothetical protein